MPISAPAPTSSFTLATLRELLAAALFFSSIFVLASHYHVLPARIHSPFNHGGDRNGMASKEQLWLLIFLGGWIYFLMSILNLFRPENVHWPTLLTPDQRATLFERCKALMGWFKVALNAALLFVTYRLCTHPR